MNQKNILFSIVIACISLSSCKVNALISCGNVQTLNTDLGYVNVGGLNFGNLLLVDTTHKALNNWKIISYDPTDIKPVEAGASLKNNIKSGLSVTLSGSGASDAISAGVNASLSNELNFHVVNYDRKDFANPSSILQSSANAVIFTACKDPARKGQIVMLVTSVTFGDTNQIYIDKQRAVSANASSQKIGKFSVSVTYNCSGDYEKIGHAVNLYFRPQFFMCDPDQGLIDITSLRQFDLTAYNFVQALN